jgi:quercetin dioxygenase-like cupin family protein
VTTAAVVAAALCPVARVQAQDDAASAPSPVRVLAAESLSPQTQLTALELVMAPAQSSPAHRHAGSVFVYVLEGAVRSQLNDDAPVVYEAGQSWFEPDGALHTLTENASANQPARLLVVFVAPKDQPATTFEE